MPIKRLRIIVDTWDAERITGHTVEEAPSAVVQVCNPSQPAPLIEPSYLYPGAPLNLLLAEQQPDGTLLPQHIVLDPDFLVDVTAICRCFTHMGDAPAYHLIGKFMPSPTSAAILLGNVANQLLDDCVNLPDPDLRTSLVKAFCTDPLRFATVPGIDSQFSEACKQQFANIRSIVAQWRAPMPKSTSEATLSEAPIPSSEAPITPSEAPVTPPSEAPAPPSFPLPNSQLEMAFICEALGIQGRMDLISADHQHIVELKSGRGEEYGHPAGQPGFRYEHAMQMALYKESLYYNAGLPYARVHTYLLYSRYPQLHDIHLGRTDIHRAVAVRNGIVHLENLLRQRPAQLLDMLSEAHFNVRGIYDRFYCQFLQPTIRAFLSQLHGMSPLEHAYFHTFLAFVEREQCLAKTGVEGESLPPGYGGFADVWRQDLARKQQAGNIICHLSIVPVMADGLVVAIDAQVQVDADAMNFRPGDMVMLHEEGADGSARQQRLAAAAYTSAIIEEMWADRLRLHLRFPQRDAGLFRTDRTYAIEPAHADAAYTTIYRGLYALLSAPEDRRQLILGQRMPQFDRTQTLCLPIADAEGHDITLRAKQAQDYFLLVGPPGTGKTSVALKRMVQEFLAAAPGTTAQPSAGGTLPSALLLLAYTNRAVDEICTMLDTIGTEADYIRIGPELSCAPAHRAHLLSQLAGNTPTRQTLRGLLQQAPIIVGTIASISTSTEVFLLKHFHTAIIDEASQVLEPQLMPLLCATHPDGTCAIGKFIFIGDHKQLPAVVTQANDLSAVTDPQLTAIGLRNCRDSLFERLHRLATMRQEPHTVALLHRQGRMHPSLSAFVSQHYYGGQLTEVPVPHQLAGLEWVHYDATSPLQKLLATQRLALLPVLQGADARGHKSNAAEARLVAQLVQALTALCQQNGQATDWAKRVGIIVPFRNQIALIRKEMSHLDIPAYEQINIDTVERYQGSQRDIIIFSTTVSTPYELAILSAPVQMDDGLIDRKLNVAITRARKQFFLVGNPSLLSQSEPYRLLILQLNASAAAPAATS